MVTTYFLRERTTYRSSGDQMILRIIDRDTLLVGTLFGCVYTTREDAARLLRAYRQRRDNPFMYEGEQISFVSYEKNVTT